MESIPQTGVPTKIYAGTAGPRVGTKRDDVAECSGANASSAPYIHYELKNHYAGYCENYEIAFHGSRIAIFQSLTQFTTKRQQASSLYFYFCTKMIHLE